MKLSKYSVIFHDFHRVLATRVFSLLAVLHCFHEFYARPKKVGLEKFHCFHRVLATGVFYLLAVLHCFHRVLATPKEVGLAVLHDFHRVLATKFFNVLAVLHCFRGKQSYAILLRILLLNSAKIMFR